jgi:hypothetical protein
MRNKLHNCKGCLWSGVCAFENTELSKCKDYYSVYGNSYDDQRSNEYNQALQERSNDYMDIVREMCDELYE